MSALTDPDAARAGSLWSGDVKQSEDANMRSPDGIGPAGAAASATPLQLLPDCSAPGTAQLPGSETVLVLAPATNEPTTDAAINAWAPTPLKSIRRCALITHAEQTPEADADADSDSKTERERKERFLRQCRWLGLTEAAARDWLGISDRPLTCLALFYVAATLHVGIVLLTFVCNSPGNLFIHVMAYWWVALFVWLGFMVWRVGPHFVATYRIGRVVPIVIAVSFMPLAASGLLSFGTGKIPYNSELIYMLALATHNFAVLLGALPVLPADQEHVKHMTLPGMIWVSAVRTARFVDGESDLAVAINLIIKGFVDCPADSASCGTLKALGCVACVLAVGDLMLTLTTSLLGQEYQKRQDITARRLLLMLYSASAGCELGMLGIHAFTLSSSSSGSSDVAHDTQMQLFIALSAVTTIVSLAANVIGAKKLFRLIYVVVVGTPPCDRAKAIAMSEFVSSTVVSSRVTQASMPRYLEPPQLGGCFRSGEFLNVSHGRRRPSAIGGATDPGCSGHSSSRVPLRHHADGFPDPELLRGSVAKRDGRKSLVTFADALVFPVQVGSDNGGTAVTTA